MLGVSAPGFGDRGHGAAQDAHTVAAVVLGGLSDEYPDAWKSYLPLTKLGYDHRPLNQSAAHRCGEGPDEIPRVHRTISNLKSWLKGTHRGFSGEHLQVYLDEYTFRFNRRHTPMAAFQSLLGLQSQQHPGTHRSIIAVGQALKTRRS